MNKNNKAITNEIERRVEEMKKFNYHNPYRLATINLLEELAGAIDHYQKQVATTFKSIEWYKNQGMKASSLQSYHNWNIQKGALTRLQERYRKTLEILNPYT